MRAGVWAPPPWRRLVAAGAILIVSGCRTSAPHVAHVDSLAAPPSIPAGEQQLSQALAHYLQGMILANEDESSARAVEHFSAAADLDPNRQRIYARIAEVQFRKGEGEQAIETLEQLSKKAPQSAQAVATLAKSCLLANRLDEATLHYERLSRMLPEASIVYITLARLHFFADQDDLALSTLKTGLKKAAQPDALLSALHASAREFLEEDQPERALRCLLFLEKHSRKDRAQVLYAIGRVYESMGKTKDALRYYTLATNAEPPLPLPYVDISRLQQDSEPDNALRTLTRGLKRIPNDLTLRVALAGEQTRLEQFDQAVLTYGGILDEIRDSETQKPLPSFFIQYSTACLKAGQPEKAESLLKSCLQQYPGSRLTSLHLVYLYIEERRYAEAADTFGRILDEMNEEERKEMTADVYVQYGAILDQAKRSEKSEQVLLDCVQRFPDAHEALNYLAYVWAEKGIRLAQAIDFATRALKLMPDKAEYVDTLGWILYKQGKAQEALEQILKANELMKDDATVLDHLGDVYQALGRRTEAVSCWERSLMLDPSKTSVAEKLQPSDTPSPSASATSPTTATSIP